MFKSAYRAFYCSPCSIFLDCTCLILLWGRYVFKGSFSDFFFFFPPSHPGILLEKRHLSAHSLHRTLGLQVPPWTHFWPSVQSVTQLPPCVPDILKANGPSSSSFIWSKSTLFPFESTEETVLRLWWATRNLGTMKKQEHFSASWGSRLGLGTSS